MEDPQPLLILLRSGATAIALRRLLDDCGTPEAAVAGGSARWREAGIDAPSARRIAVPDQVTLASDQRWLERPGHHLLGWHQPDYPSLLRTGVYPPAALFVRGDPTLLWHPQIAVVGSRQPSAGGRDNARQFARSFGRAGFGVTSGMAHGVDAAAHRGVMETFRTVAVMGTGPDLCYPAANAGLMEAIAAQGALVTEHLPGTPGIRSHFPSRNRLIAGLTLATVVIEAAVRSGALITARMAIDAGREVFALPGSIHNPMARGCHRLIRDGAVLTETPEEVIEAVAPLAGLLAGALQDRLALPERAAAAVAGGGAERAVWRALGHDPVNVDQLSARTGLTVGPLSAMLLAMEMDGKISAEHGRYSRRS